MNPKEFDQYFQKNKDTFHNYIDNIKKNIPWNLYSIINSTLIKNPYASSFPQNYFSNKLKFQNKYFLLIKNVFKLYLKNIYLLISYFIAFIFYKLYFKKKRRNNLETIIDVFGLVDKVNKNNKFTENYLIGIYEQFEKFNENYTVLLRPYGADRNPFKLIKFFKIISNDKRDFVFDYEFLSFFDFFKLLSMILKYPFKILNIKQKEENDIARIFNNSLIEDFKYFSFDSLTRYLLGKNLSKIKSIRIIYSWSEFQVIERSFNYAIRKNCNHIKLVGLQFYINYDTYFSSRPDDIDYDMLSSPHKILVNGKYYLRNKKKIKYEAGVSLRYRDVFNFKGIKEEKNILVLGSYIENDTKFMLDSVKKFDDLIFKNHPVVNIEKFGKLTNSIKISGKSIQELFESTKIVIVTSASGTAVEAVSCGIPVIIVASQYNLRANALVENGRGKIWDIAFNINEIYDIYKKLINYKANNNNEIMELANWYKNNFFIEPTEKNIIEVFELDKKKSDKNFLLN